MHPCWLAFPRVCFWWQGCCFGRWWWWEIQRLWISVFRKTGMETTFWTQVGRKLLGVAVLVGEFPLPRGSNVVPQHIVGAASRASLLFQDLRAGPGAILYYRVVFTCGPRLLWHSWVSEAHLEETMVSPWHPKEEVYPLIPSCYMPGWF